MDFVALLKENTLTVTPQRVEILNILSANQHINVDELYALLRHSFASISLATAYKNINTMLAKCILTEVQIPNKKNVYELVSKEHSHLTCTQCNEILDLHLDLTKLYKEAESKSAYKLGNSSIVFSGICPKCKLS